MGLQIHNKTIYTIKHMYTKVKNHPVKKVMYIVYLNSIHWVHRNVLITLYVIYSHNSPYESYVGKLVKAYIS
jgi:hypothetical protein